jgi:hypothetical protein
MGKFQVARKAKVLRRLFGMCSGICQLLHGHRARSPSQTKRRMFFGEMNEAGVDYGSAP